MLTLHPSPFLTVPASCRANSACSLAACLTCVFFLSSWPQFASAQNQSPLGDAAPQAELIIGQDQIQQIASEAAAARSAVPPQPALGVERGINFISLLIQGGGLMIPIAVMSLLVVAMTLERWFNLRTGKLLPRKLRRGIEHFAEQRYSVDPQEIYQLSQRFPSAAARAVESLLQKIGRPVPEMNAAVEDCCQRETDRMYGNVRWLTLAASITPLIGLLGTVWGMIIAFFQTTQLDPGRNKAEYLAEGIYVALVTTLGGLAVAIPAAIFAHYFEGRITQQIRRIEELVLRLIPRFERFEGKLRFDIEPTGLVPRALHSETNQLPGATESPIQYSSNVVGGLHQSPITKAVVPPANRPLVTKKT